MWSLVKFAYPQKRRDPNAKKDYPYNGTYEHVFHML